jgi:hypothetical protein
LIVFGRTPEDEVLRTIVPLDDSSVESAYASLKRALEVVSAALEGVDEENLQSEGATRASKNALSNELEWAKIKRGLQIVERIKSIVV